MKVSTLISIVAISLLAAGCGTPKEKTAPCKRPANLTGYAADPRVECGPMRSINADRGASLAAIDGLAGQAE